MIKVNNMAYNLIIYICPLHPCGAMASFNPFFIRQEGRSEKQKTEGDWIEKNKIAYVKIPSFGEPRFENDALDLVKRYKKARALIIDVRRNTGGSTPSQLIQALMDRPYRWYEESTPMILASFREDFYDSHFLRRSDYNKPENTIFTGKLIILIDRMTGMPDGSRFEGVGIAPDIEIKLERMDLCKGKDKIFDAALEVSRKHAHSLDSLDRSAIYL